jgi:hypothetical protein
MRRIAHLSALLLAIVLGGCAMASVALYKFSGPPDVPAKYVPAQEPTVLLVENYRHQSSVNAQAETLARLLADDLEAHKVAPLVPIDEIQALRDAHPKDFPTMTVVQIAQALHAKQVIYVELRNADVSPLAGGTGYTGEATAMVKVIDGITGQTAWPIEYNDGYAVSTQTKMGSKNYPTPADVRNVLYAQLTDEISKLFHKWKPQDDTSDIHTEASK